MSYSGNITHKCQLSAQAMLQAAVAGEYIDIASSSIYAGIGTDEMVLPRVICECRRATPEMIYDTNWSADLVIRVEASAQDTGQDAFHTLVSAVFARFLQDKDTVCTEISNSTVEFTAFAVEPAEQGWDINSGDGEHPGTWAAELRLTVKCAGSVIS